ncbi:MAG: VWA domain-containing protein [Deltaproteobacteria bacterium]|nr:MAG: VWA domain-containing protein [Deltaproteobacteria bacterium]
MHVRSPLARPRSALFPLLLAAAGCSDHSFTAAGGDGDPSAPAIEVSPTFVDFGTLGQDDEPIVRSFTITSVGGIDLVVDGIEMMGDAGSFTILSDPTHFTLPPGASQDIEVAFSPLGAYQQMGQSVITSNDPDTPQALVELTGEGAVPELLIQPDPVDFGETWVGCDDELDVYLSNVGTDDLVITDLHYEGDDAGVFSEIQGLSLPLTLAPGEEAQVRLDFAPIDAIAYSGSLVVESNEPAGVREGRIVGDGAYAGEYTDIWEIPVDPPSDIMFLVDQSCSMGDDQARLANNFSTFISSLDGYTTDWQIMVVNDDDGCSNSGILKRTTSGYQSIFQSAVKEGGGDYTEALLTVGTHAVEKTDPGECNTTFLREDAMLHMIFVSDEPEQSPGSWSSYLDQIIAKKGSAANVRMSAIAGPVGTSSCADPGTGYADVVNATGGVFLDICSNWATSANLADLAEASVFQDTYELSREPIVDTITVKVNDSNRANGWSYDATINAVVFSGNIPGEGDRVEVSYAGVATCD